MGTYYENIFFESINLADWSVYQLSNSEHNIVTLFRAA